MSFAAMGSAPRVCKEMSSKLLNLAELQALWSYRHNRILTTLFYSKRNCTSAAKTEPESNEPAFDYSEKLSSNVSQDILAKVKYNSILSARAHFSFLKRKRLEKQEMIDRLEDKRSHLPLSLKYAHSDNIENVESRKMKEQINERIVFPFSDNKTIHKYTGENLETSELSSEEENSNDKLKNWMDDYEIYNTFRNQNMNSSELIYGTPNSSVPISNVPCGGCGALLHCQDTAIPGYLPSELFRNCTVAELRSMKCQRCHFLENYNMALNLNVSPDAYSLMMEHLKKKRALAIVLVDIADFPCSMWPGIIDIVGTKRPVVVVGNKVDLLPSDCRKFLMYAQWWLEEAVKRSELAAANVKHITLVSAKTGFGIEQLITKLQCIWKPEGDVYLLGCTNVGKSTLFNALVKSDYCKVQAVDIMQRATTSEWPGTTLHLLKFPIQRPKRHILYQRVLRLRDLAVKEKAKEELLRNQLKFSRNPLDATFIGQISCTARDLTNASDAKDPFSMKSTAMTQVKPKLGLDPNREEFQESKWCFDTPGAVHPDQVLHLLTADELLLTLPRCMLIPRTFLLQPGDSLLLAGLARIDFLSHRRRGRTRFTVFAAATLPITVCCTAHVEEVYSALAAANALRVPSAQKERLAQWPGLVPAPQEFTVSGVHNSESAADIVLSSAGWVAVTPGVEQDCVLLAWTPHGRGIFLRTPPLMRYSVILRGPMVRKTPAYHQGRAVVV